MAKDAATFIPYGGHPEFWEPLSPQVQEGLELAAEVCRLYGSGEPWAEVILNRSEQIRARFAQLAKVTTTSLTGE